MSKQTTKSNNRTSSKSTTKSTKSSSTKTSATSKLNSSTPGRAKPMTPKAGFTQTKRRYENGGKWCW